MTYLIAKFALLFLAATILGLLLGYWWARSRFVDITETYHSLTSRTEEERSAIDRLWNKVNAINLSPLENRVQSIEGLIRNIPAPEKVEPVNLKPVHEHIQRVEESVHSIPKPEKVDFLPLYQKLQLLEGKMKTIAQSNTVDITPLRSKLESLEGQLKSMPQPPKVDLTPVQQRLQSLEIQLKSMPKPEKTDLVPLHSRLQALEGQLRSIPQPAKVDLTPVQQRLQSLEVQLKSMPRPEKTDLAPLYSRLQSLETQLKSLPQPAKVDLAPIQGKLQFLGDRINSLPAQVKPQHINLEPLNQRMARFEQLLQSINSTESVNLEPIESRLQSIETKLSGLPANMEASHVQKKAPRLLRSASMGKKDDLKKISGVGPKLERLLNEIGVYYFWQVASWNTSEVQAVDDMLEVFKGRIERDRWVSQAKKLKLDPKAAQEKPGSVMLKETNGTTTTDNGLAALFAK